MLFIQRILLYTSMVQAWFSVIVYSESKYYPHVDVIPDLGQTWFDKDHKSHLPIGKPFLPDKNSLYQRFDETLAEKSSSAHRSTPLVPDLESVKAIVRSSSRLNSNPLQTIVGDTFYGLDHADLKDDTTIYDGLTNDQHALAAKGLPVLSNEASEVKAVEPEEDIHVALHPLQNTASIIQSFKGPSPLKQVQENALDHGEVLNHLKVLTDTDSVEQKVLPVQGIQNEELDGQMQEQDAFLKSSPQIHQFPNFKQVTGVSVNDAANSQSEALNPHLVGLLAQKSESKKHHHRFIVDTDTGDVIPAPSHDYDELARELSASRHRLPLPKHEELSRDKSSHSHGHSTHHTKEIKSIRYNDAAFFHNDENEVPSRMASHSNYVKNESHFNEYFRHHLHHPPIHLMDDSNSGVYKESRKWNADGSLPLNSYGNSSENTKVHDTEQKLPLYNDLFPPDARDRADARPEQDDSFKDSNVLTVEYHRDASNSNASMDDLPSDDHYEPHKNINDKVEDSNLSTARRVPGRKVDYPTSMLSSSTPHHSKDESQRELSIEKKIGSVPNKDFYDNNSDRGTNTNRAHLTETTLGKELSEADTATNQIEPDQENRSTKEVEKTSNPYLKNGNSNRFHESQNPHVRSNHIKTDYSQGPSETIILPLDGTNVHIDVSDLKKVVENFSAKEKSLEDTNDKFETMKSMTEDGYHSEAEKLKDGRNAEITLKEEHRANSEKRMNDNDAEVLDEHGDNTDKIRYSNERTVKESDMADKNNARESKWIELESGSFDVSNGVGERSSFFSNENKQSENDFKIKVDNSEIRSSHDELLGQERTQYNSDDKIDLNDGAKSDSTMYFLKSKSPKGKFEAKHDMPNMDPIEDGEKGRKSSKVERYSNHRESSSESNTLGGHGMFQDMQSSDNLIDPGRSDGKMFHHPKLTEKTMLKKPEASYLNLDVLSSKYEIPDHQKTLPIANPGHPDDSNGIIRLPSRNISPPWQVNSPTSESNVKSKTIPSKLKMLSKKFESALTKALISKHSSLSGADSQLALQPFVIASQSSQSGKHKISDVIGTRRSVTGHHNKFKHPAALSAEFKLSRNSFRRNVPIKHKERFVSKSVPKKTLGRIKRTEQTKTSEKVLSKRKDISINDYNLKQHFIQELAENMDKPKHRKRVLSLQSSDDSSFRRSAKQ